MKKILLLSSLFMLALMVTSCKNAAEATVSETVDAVKSGAEKVKSGAEKVMKIVKQTDLTAKEYTSAYTCPMHCVGSGSDEPGKCPACKMDLAKNLSGDKHDDHSGHDHDHSGHDHSH